MTVRTTYHDVARSMICMPGALLCGWSDERTVRSVSKKARERLSGWF